MSEEKAAKKPYEGMFSWGIAEMTDRHKEMENVDVTGRLAAIHRIYDPGHKKVLARLMRSYAEERGGDKNVHDEPVG